MQKKYIKYVILILFMSMQISVSAQSSNPFEVVHTKKYLNSNKDSADKSIHVNKIEQSKSDINTNEQSPVENSNLIESNSITTQNTAEVRHTEQQTVGTSSNPFSVTHGTNQSGKSGDSLDISTDTNSSTDIDNTQELDKNHEEPVNTNEENELTKPVVNSNLEDGDKNLQDSNPFSVQSNTNKTNKSSEDQEKLDQMVSEEVTTKENIKTEEKTSFFNRFNRSSDKSYETTNFIFWIIFFTIFLFAILINYRRSFILKSYRGILNENYLKLIKREERNGFSPFFISLFVVFLLSIAIFIYLILLKIYNNDVGFWGYLYIFLGVFIVYVVRYIIIKLIGYIFGLEKVTEKYFFIILYYNVLLGICLLIINIFFAFGSDLIIAYSFKFGLVITVGLLFIRIIRGFLLSIQDNFIFKIQFILYLCAVEIAPTFILMKYLSGFSNSFI